MFKHDTGRHRLAFNVPYPNNRRIATLLKHLQRELPLAGKPKDWPLFRGPNEQPTPLCSEDISSVMRKLLRHLQHSPPLGCKHTAKATRSDAVSAACSVGVDIETIRWMWGSKSMGVLRQHYLDPRTQPSPAAEEFFGHLRLTSQTPSPQMEQ